jgi:hypothetical protein
LKLHADNAPLTRRGFQERYLAGRTLHYSKGYVSFGCKTIIASAYNKSGQHYLSKTNIQADGKLYAWLDVEQVKK